MEDLLWAYHDLKDLYDDDDDVESIQSESMGCSSPIKRQECDDHQTQGPHEKRENDDDDEENDNSDEDDEDRTPTTKNNGSNNNKKITTTTKTKNRHRHQSHDGDNEKNIEKEKRWIRRRSNKRLNQASLKHLMVGLESPSMFSPRAIMLKNDAFLDSLDVVVTNKNESFDGGGDDRTELENSKNDLMVGKRIEVQWDMNDKTRRWYAGTVQSISNDGSEAVLLYDDGECCLMDNIDPMEWRPVTTAAVIVEKDKTMATKQKFSSNNDDKTKTTTIESFIFPSTGISGIMLPSSPIVGKKKKKNRSSSSSLSLHNMKTVTTNKKKKKHNQKKKHIPLVPKQKENKTLAVKKRKRFQPESHPARRRPVPPPIKISAPLAPPARAPAPIKAKGIGFSLFSRPLLENEEMLF